MKSLTISLLCALAWNIGLTADDANTVDYEKVAQTTKLTFVAELHRHPSMTNDEWVTYCKSFFELFPKLDTLDFEKTVDALSNAMKKLPKVGDKETMLHGNISLHASSDTTTTKQE